MSSRYIDVVQEPDEEASLDGCAPVLRARQGRELGYKLSWSYTRVDA
jgi:hypothetical protein